LRYSFRFNQPVDDSHYNKPQQKRLLDEGPGRPPKRKKLFGQSKINPSLNLGAFGPKTLYTVLSDAGRGGSAAMQTFAEYVYRGAKAVVGVVWAQPPVLEVRDLEVTVQKAFSVGKDES